MSEALLKGMQSVYEHYATNHVPRVQQLVDQQRVEAERLLAYQAQAMSQYKLELVSSHQRALNAVSFMMLPSCWCRVRG